MQSTAMYTNVRLGISECSDICSTVHSVYTYIWTLEIGHHFLFLEVNNDNTREGEVQNGDTTSLICHTPSNTKSTYLVV
jgi:hypothetical protein